MYSFFFFFHSFLLNTHRERLDLKRSKKKTKIKLMFNSSYFFPALITLQFVFLFPYFCYSRNSTIVGSFTEGEKKKPPNIKSLSFVMGPVAC